MESFNTEMFVAVLALIGTVILISALLSGLIERSGVPQVAVFLGLGAVLGPAGMGLLDITLESPVLRVVATLSLVLCCSPMRDPISARDSALQPDDTLSAQAADADDCLAGDRSGWSLVEDACSREYQ